MVKQVKQDKEKESKGKTTSVGKQVRIDWDVYNHIIKQSSTYGETFSNILRRLLGLTKET